MLFSDNKVAVWSDQRGEGAKEPSSYYKINASDIVKQIMTEIQGQLKPTYNTVITGYSLIGVIAPGKCTYYINSRIRACQGYDCCWF